MYWYVSVRTSTIWILGKPRYRGKSTRYQYILILYPILARGTFLKVPGPDIGNTPGDIGVKPDIGVYSDIGPIIGYYPYTPISGLYTTDVGAPDIHLESYTP